MIKRRRLANKMTIMVCAVLIAVSAFFYAPMDVSASSLSGGSDSNTSKFSGSLLSGKARGVRQSGLSLDLPCLENLTVGQYYIVNYSGNLSISQNVSCSLSTLALNLNFAGVDISLYHANDVLNGKTFNLPFSGSFVYKAVDSPVVTYEYSTFAFSESASGTFTQNHTLNFSVDSFELISSDSGDNYNQGYEAGFLAGEQAGYGNGYSNGFADGEASVDTDKIYDEAFQAGKDSVDTQSYYDAGYQAGYQVSYQAGYDSGYDEGYQSAMNRMDGWGADTSQYPLLVFEKSLSDISIQAEVNTNMPQVAYGSEFLASFDFDVVPHHTYKIVFNSSKKSESWLDFQGSQDEQLNYNIGSYSFPWYFGESFAFVEGSNLASNILLECFVYAAHFYDTDGVYDNSDFLPWGSAALVFLDYIDISVFDYGPSGDTQNHIANQTDKLTGGWDGSSGSSANSDLTSGLNEFETAENSLFATATTGMKDFTFFDIESVPAMLTAVTFITSIMGSWFEQAGGASGVGIVLSILFSVMLVSMVLGLYRLYQSAGHRAEARQRHAENMERWKKGK